MQDMKLDLVKNKVDEEFKNQQERLVVKIKEMGRLVDGEMTGYRSDNVHRMAENQGLLNEINALRVIAKHKPTKNSMSDEFSKLPAIRGVTTPLPSLPTFQSIG